MNFLRRRKHSSSEADPEGGRARTPEELPVDGGQPSTVSMLIESSYRRVVRRHSEPFPERQGPPLHASNNQCVASTTVLPLPDKNTYLIL